MKRDLQILPLHAFWFTIHIIFFIPRVGRARRWRRRRWRRVIEVNSQNLKIKSSLLYFLFFISPQNVDGNMFSHYICNCRPQLYLKALTSDDQTYEDRNLCEWFDCIKFKILINKDIFWWKSSQRYVSKNIRMTFWKRVWRAFNGIQKTTSDM